jgi:hypothetical protein
MPRPSTPRCPECKDDEAGILRPLRYQQYSKVALGSRMQRVPGLLVCEKCHSIFSAKSSFEKRLGAEAGA